MTAAPEPGGPRAFVFEQRIRAKHCDPAGIVFYPRYFEMVSDCVEGFFESLGDPFDPAQAEGGRRGAPTGRISVEFRRPSRLGDRLAFALRCRRLGRSSLDLTLDASAEGEARLAVRLTLVHVGPSLRAEPWPPALRAALEGRLDPEEA